MCWTIEELKDDLKKSQKENERFRRLDKKNPGEGSTEETRIQQILDILSRNESIQGNMVETYKAKLAKLNQNLQTVINKFNFYKKRSITLENENNDLKTDKFLVENILNKKFRHSVHSKIFVKIYELVSEESLRKEVRSLEKYVKTREDKIGNLDKQNSSQKRELEKIKQESNDYSEEIIKIWKENEEIVILNKGLESELKILLAENKKLKKRFEGEEGDKDKLIHILKTNIRSVEDKLQEQVNLVKSLKKNLKETKRFLQINDEELRQLKIVIQKNKKTIEDLLGKGESLFENNNILKQNNDKFLSSHEKLSKELSKKIKKICKIETIISKLKNRTSEGSEGIDLEIEDLDKEDHIWMKHEYDRLNVSFLTKIIVRIC